MKGEPAPLDPLHRRYSSLPFPRYRYVPGLNPHPRNDPGGHSHGRPEPRAEPWRPADWRALTTYLFGIDLYNFAYWWESHEQLEALWLGAGRTTPPARFVQGIIQLSAAALNAHLGKTATAHEQAERGLARLADAVTTNRSVFMGIDVGDLDERVRRWMSGAGRRPAVIRLEP